jgi:TolB-like protein
LNLLPLPDKPSIAILPFDNMGEAGEDLYSADGIAFRVIAPEGTHPRTHCDPITAASFAFVQTGSGSCPESAGGICDGARYTRTGGLRRVAGTGLDADDQGEQLGTLTGHQTHPHLLARR